MTSAFSWQNSMSLCPASFHTPKPNVPVTPGVSWLPTLHIVCNKYFWNENKPKHSEGWLPERLGPEREVKTKKLRRRAVTAWAQACPPGRPLSLQNRAWERHGSAWPPPAGKNHGGSGPSGSAPAVTWPPLGLAALWLCPETPSFFHQPELSWGACVYMNSLCPCPGNCLLSTTVWGTLDHCCLTLLTCWAPVVCQALSWVLWLQSWKLPYLPSWQLLSTGIMVSQQCSAEDNFCVTGNFRPLSA